MGDGSVRAVRTSHFSLPTSQLPSRLAFCVPPTPILDLAPSDARARLAAWAEARGLPAYRARQLERRLWVAPVAAWADATELPESLRAELDAEWPLTRLSLEAEQRSADGTVKYLWRLADGEAIESVLIPSAGRRTLCVSSQ